MSGMVCSSRVLRSAKGKTRAIGEKGLIMGPVKDWRKKSVVISGGSQFTLEDVTKEGWEKLGKMKEMGGALTHAAEVGKKMFEKDNNALHLK